MSRYNRGLKGKDNLISNFVQIILIGRRFEKRKAVIEVGACHLSAHDSFDERKQSIKAAVSFSR